MPNGGGRHPYGLRLAYWFPDAKMRAPVQELSQASSRSPTPGGGSFRDTLPRGQAVPESGGYSVRQALPGAGPRLLRYVRRSLPTCPKEGRVEWPQLRRADPDERPSPDSRRRLTKPAGCAASDKNPRVVLGVGGPDGRPCRLPAATQRAGPRREAQWSCTPILHQESMSRAAASGCGPRR